MKISKATLIGLRIFATPLAIAFYAVLLPFAYMVTGKGLVDARRIARVPSMEEEIIRLRGLLLKERSND